MKVCVSRFFLLSEEEWQLLFHHSLPTGISILTNLLSFLIIMADSELSFTPGGYFDSWTNLYTQDISIFQTKLNGAEALTKYRNFFKGVTNTTTGEVISECDLDFLRAIMDDLDIMMEVIWDGGTLFKVDRDMWSSAMDTIIEEVKRLTQFPKLIPDNDLRDGFLEYVENFCRFFEDEQHLPSLDNVVEQINLDLRNKHRGSYDRHRVPWHQFLHNLAPGSSSNIGEHCNITGTGSRQIVPPGGIRLLRTWERDMIEIQRLCRPRERIEDTRIVLKPTAYKERAIGGRSRYRLMGTIAHGPTYMQQLVEPGYQSLEILSNLYDQWDMNQVPMSQGHPAPYMFVAECCEEEYRKWNCVTKPQPGEDHDGDDDDNE
jgi:hypothetical protein